MTNVTKFYSTKSNAKRAAIGAGMNLETAKLVETRENGFAYVQDLTKLDSDGANGVCPHCGINHKDNGYSTYTDIVESVGNKQAEDVNNEYVCLACWGQWGPAVVRTEKKPAAAKRTVVVTHESTVERPCKLVWQIADDMKAANPKVTRREVLAVAVERGVAYYTARTQYQQWLSVQREMSEREAQQAKK